MEKVKNSYEALFIVDVTRGEETIEATVSKFRDLIETNGEIVDFAKWGKRRLAYPINDMPEGYYAIITFKSASEFPAELERLFNIDEAIMRSKVLRLGYDAAKRKADLAAKAIADAAAAKAAAEAAAQAAAEAAAAENTADAASAPETAE